ncbi:MFS transporter [Picrophilus oshimae]|uniref:Transporter n=1 Tax=Picrophilus torridus (strain ATCC 700027 / DSM 9790 / JCM 10055 / NBRC 100828 / KAW 2/3) TaxID=1122961 RepID=Q6L1P3_PICTO|nr:MFS transporter [Picrophilus oshimae]AAT43109.1 transporter [Picrophilus oshimae DSM 9789]
MSFNNSSRFIPVFAYSISTFFLMNFAFFIPELVKTYHFSYIESFILLGSPFIGRAFTPFLYSNFSKIGVHRLAMLSISIMSLFSIFEAFTHAFSILLIFRLLTGIFFGLATSAAVEVSAVSGNKILMGLTMGGWAIGWTLAAVLYTILGSVFYISLAGSVFLPSVFFSKKLNVISPHVKKYKMDFSIRAFLVFFLGFTPAYILEIVPTYLPDSSIESIIAYSIAVPVYVMIPFMINRFGIRNVAYVSISMAALSGILLFSTYNIYIAILFTAVGLGINSILPVVSRSLNIDPKKIGPSMNFSSIIGFMIPVLITIGNVSLNSSLMLGLALVILILFIGTNGFKISYSKNTITRHHHN